MVTVSENEAGKLPRTGRGQRTRQTLLDAAAAEFGEKGFHESSIVSITQRAGIALGSFYTYFDSKDALFRALVQHMSSQVRISIGPVIAAGTDRISGERDGLVAFLNFVREHKELYRIIDEAEFVEPASFRNHYREMVAGYLISLTEAAARGEVRRDIDEVHAWAIVGMNVFLGLRYGVWSEDRSCEEIASIASDMLANGISNRN